LILFSLTHRLLVSRHVVPATEDASYWQTPGQVHLQYLLICVFFSSVEIKYILFFCFLFIYFIIILVCYQSSPANALSSGENGEANIQRLAVNCVLKTTHLTCYRQEALLSRMVDLGVFSFSLSIFSHLCTSGYYFFSLLVRLLCTVQHVAQRHRHVGLDADSLVSCIFSFV
jgi:hypothetical protein